MLSAFRLEMSSCEACGFPSHTKMACSVCVYHPCILHPIGSIYREFCCSLFEEMKDMSLHFFNDKEERVAVGSVLDEVVENSPQPLENEDKTTQKMNCVKCGVNYDPANKESKFCSIICATKLDSKSTKQKSKESRPTNSRKKDKLGFFWKTEGRSDNRSWRRANSESWRKNASEQEKK